MNQTTTVLTDARPASASSSTEPLLLVSSDTHISPSMDELRAYCPKRYLRDYDDHVATVRAALTDTTPLAYVVQGTEEGTPRAEQIRANMNAEGCRDVHARLRDLDRDGVAAGVIFHGSGSWHEWMPWGTSSGGVERRRFDASLELVAVGLHMYNEWLADACSVEPERHVGLVHVPLWDVDAAVRELTWGRERGLRAVNFPVWFEELGAGYDDRAWESFWSACEDLGMVLANHAGVANDAPPALVRTSIALIHLEASAASRKIVGRLVLGGVFQRHPGLKLVLTEQAAAWCAQLARELNEVYTTWQPKLLPIWHPTAPRPPELPTMQEVPKLPSEYIANNVFVGASFMAPFEAEAAVRDGYARNMLWGSDYPHPEGTWQLPFDEDAVPITHLALRNTFSNIPPDDIRLMAGENAIDVYGLDRSSLQRVAQRINAPTIEFVTTPLAPESIPAIVSPHAFRRLSQSG